MHIIAYPFMGRKARRLAPSQRQALMSLFHGPHVRTQSGEYERMGHQHTRKETQKPSEPEGDAMKERFSPLWLRIGAANKCPAQHLFVFIQGSVLIGSLSCCVCFLGLCDTISAVV